MAHPLLGLAKKLVVEQIIDRAVDRKKPMSTTLASTGGAAGLITIALPMLDAPEENTRYIGLALMGLAVYL